MAVSEQKHAGKTEKSASPNQPHEPVLSRDATVTVYGASDDLVELTGAIYDEFGCFATRGGILTFNEGTKLRINYGPDGTGCWRIERIAEGSASYTHTPADGEDTDNYSDRVTLRGDLRSVRFRKAKAPTKRAPKPPVAASPSGDGAPTPGEEALTRYDGLRLLLAATSNGDGLAYFTTNHARLLDRLLRENHALTADAALGRAVRESGLIDAAERVSAQLEAIVRSTFPPKDRVLLHRITTALTALRAALPEGPSVTGPADVSRSEGNPNRSEGPLPSTNSSSVSSSLVDAPTCPHCGGEMIQFEDGPDDTLECAHCDGKGPPECGECGHATHPPRQCADCQCLWGMASPPPGGPTP
jgi:hypothetical protein